MAPHEVLLGLWCVLHLTSLVDPAKVLLVSFDGFRWDYFNRGDEELPNFRRLADEGCYAPYINNTFTTMTFSTHYSMATGLYEESHGIVGNYMYDPVFNASFHPGTVEARWWGDAEPIWDTARRQHLRVGCYFWPGTGVSRAREHAPVFEPYNKRTPFKKRVDTVMKWMTKRDMDFVPLYFHEPDLTGHRYGPHSPEVRAKVIEMDGVLGYLLDEMDANNLTDITDLILVSDHGMAEISPRRVVQVPDYFNSTDDFHAHVTKFVELGSLCHVFPRPGRAQHVYDRLTGRHAHMHVTWKRDTPDHWHYRRHRRIADILLIMDEGWTCTEDLSSSWNQELGTHGYDNGLMSMKPLFFARGPDFKSNFTSSPFLSLDIYPLLCHLLDITPAANNGSMEHVVDLLEEDLGLGGARVAAYSGTAPLWPSLTALCLITVLGVLMCGA